MKTLVMLATLCICSISGAAENLPRTLPKPNPAVIASEIFVPVVDQKVTKVCCLNREKVDGGRRIGPVYRVRNDYCNKGEETVEMKFCRGPNRL